MLNKSMLNSMLPSFFFDVTSLQIFDVIFVSMLHFSMSLYSMLLPSIETLFEVINFGPWICQKKIWPAMKFELYTPDLQCVMDLD